MQYMWAGLSFLWISGCQCHEKLSSAHIYCVNMAHIVAYGSQGMWLIIVASGSERVNTDSVSLIEACTLHRVGRDKDPRGRWEERGAEVGAFVGS